MPDLRPARLNLYTEAQMRNATKNATKTDRDEAYRTLLRDFGYGYDANGYLYARAIRGFCPARRMSPARSPMDAAEQACPIVADPDYTARLAALGRPTP